MILDTLTTNTDFNTISFTLVAAVVAAHLLPWLWDSHGLRLYPGPFLAKFSDLWLGWVSAHGHRSEVVHDMHKTYGKTTIAGSYHTQLLTPSRSLRSVGPQPCLHRGA